jgi:isoleucyl-tRNA synthetase
MNQFKDGEKVSFEIEGTAVELEQSDILIETTQKEGMVSESDAGVTVVLDTNLTPQLVEEGFVREIVSKVQTMRKEAGFEVVDHIKFYYKNNKKISDIVSKNMETISDEVLADEVSEGDAQGYTKEWDINGENVTFTVVKK